MIAPRLIWYAGAGVAAAALLYYAARRAQGDTRGFGAIVGGAIGRAGADVAGGVIEGTVKGAGALVGIPDTDQAQCDAAKAAGNTWDASKYCSAGDFLSWTSNRVLGRSAPASPLPPKRDAAPQRATLRQGDRGELVRELQRRVGVNDDGVFGQGTKAAVIAYQRSQGLTADGVVGARTWAALDASQAAPGAAVTPARASLPDPTYF